MALIDTYRVERQLGDDVSDREALQRLLDEKEGHFENRVISQSILAIVSGDTKLAMIASIAGLLSTSSNLSLYEKAKKLDERILEAVGVCQDLTDAARLGISTFHELWGYRVGIQLRVLLTLLEDPDDRVVVDNALHEPAKLGRDDAVRCELDVEEKVAA